MPNLKKFIKSHKILLIIVVVIFTPPIIFLSYRNYRSYHPKIFRFRDGDGYVPPKSGFYFKTLKEAIDIKDPTICNKLDDYEATAGNSPNSTTEECQIEYAINTNDLNYCLSLENNSRCILAIAQKLEDPSICQHLSSEEVGYYVFPQAFCILQLDSNPDDYVSQAEISDNLAIIGSITSISQDSLLVRVKETQYKLEYAPDSQDKTRQTIVAQQIGVGGRIFARGRKYEDHITLGDIMSLQTAIDWRRQYLPKN